MNYTEEIGGNTNIDNSKNDGKGSFETNMEWFIYYMEFICELLTPRPSINHVN